MKAKPQILYLDDEVLNLVNFEYLYRQDYEIYTASSADEGLNILRQREIHVVITDQRMPDISGVEFLEQIASDYPGIIRILLTGFSELDVVVQAINRGHVYRYLSKPWDERELRLTLVGACELYQLRSQNEQLVANLAETNATLQVRAQQLEQEVIEKTRLLERVRESEEQLRQSEKRVQNELQKRWEQEQLLIQRSKLESLGRLAAGIAHEINQPLAGILMGLDNMLLKVSSGKHTEAYCTQKIEVLLGHIDRIKHIIDHIRTFSREQALASIEKIDINEVCRNALSMLQTQYDYHNITIQVHLDKTVGFALGNPYKLEQVILNLLANARDAVDEKERKLDAFSYQKQIAIATSCDAGRIRLDVRDNGSGIPDDHHSKIFDPFFTTKDPERGTGLGLSVSYGIMKDMQGDISVQSHVGEYTLMRVSLPEMNATGVEHTQDGKSQDSYRR